MARPVKDGLNYFSLDTYFLTNTKIKRLKLKYGHMYVMYYIEILATIYREKGYYADYENVELALMDEFRTTEKEAKDIINILIEARLIDKNMFEKFHIITSKGIQEQYMQVAKRRNENCIKKEFDLIEFSEKYTQNKQSGVSVCNNSSSEGVSVCNNSSSEGVSVCNMYAETTQRKGKERKEKKTKEKREGIDSILLENNSEEESPTPHALIPYGKFNNVFLKEKEYENLKATYQDYKRLIDRLSCYLVNSRREYENHYALLIKFAVDDGYAKRPKTDNLQGKDGEQEVKGVSCPDHIQEKIKQFTGRDLKGG